MNTLKIFDKMNMQPYLSICIPTYDRLDILYNTLESIYSEIVDVNLVDFEVVISDNSPDRSAMKVVKYFEYSNLKYVSTDCDGFLNSFNALKLAEGHYLKLHNNYTKLKVGTLRDLISNIKLQLEKKPAIFYTNGLKQIYKIREFNSFDLFMFELSYFSSWSAGFGIWKSDFTKICNIEIDKMFPQTSLLIAQNTKDYFILNDLPLFDDQVVPRKGGYNIFKVFSVDYIGLMKKACEENYISYLTFCKIRKDLIYNYISIRYFKTVIARLDNFESDKIKESISIYYSSSSYYLMVIVALFSPFRILFRNIKRSIKSRIIV